MAERSLGTLTALLVLVVSALGVAVPAAAAHADIRIVASATPSPAAARAGISPGSEILWESDTELNADLDVIAASGATYVSVDFDWNSIQGDGPNSFWWSATDRVVTAAHLRGLKVIGGLAYSPPWARPTSCPADTTHCLPAHVDDYARFAAASVARYGANSPDPALRASVTAWSIWNEPNGSDFSRPRPDPAQYARMLKAAYPAIKAEDASATVVTGGTSPAGDAPDGSEYAPATWVGLLYLNGARGSFDAVGHHPYSFPTNPLETHPWNAFTQTLDIHGVMTYFGDGTKKIWGTEAGAATGTSSVAVSEADQAQFVHDYYEGWNTTYADFTGPLLWFSHRDSGTDPSAWLDNLGLLHHDGTAKPAYAAYQAMTGAAADTGVTARRGTRVATNPQGGYYLLAADGAVTAVAGAGDFGSPDLGPDLARGIAVMPDGLGYVVLDGFGGLHKFGSANRGLVGRARTPYWAGWDIARDIAITPNGRGLAVLDAFGGIHGSRALPHFSAGYWPNWPIARALAFTPSGRGAYVLDGFGGVHTDGDAVVRPGPYWPGWDIARDLTVSPTGRGYAVLDGFGSIHPSGDAPKPGRNPAYAPYDHARGVVQSGARYVVAG